MIIPDNELDDYLLDEGYGGLFDRHEELGEEEALQFEFFRRRTAELTESNARRPAFIRQFPGAVGILSEATHVDACVFQPGYTGEYYVMLSRGMDEVLWVIFNRLLSEPDVFPWIGRVSDEEADRAPNTLRVDTQLIHPEDRVAPNDRTRQFAAGWMSNTAFRWIMVHEYWHMLAGHNEFPEQLFNSRLIGERRPHTRRLAPGSHSSDQLVDQYFELEADGFAACQTLWQWLGPDSIEKLQATALFANAEDPHSAVFRATFAAIHVAVKVLGSLPKPREQWEIDEHPPEEVRRLSISRYVQKHLFEWGHEQIARNHEVNNEMLGVVDSALHRILGYPALTSEWVQYLKPGGEVEQYYDRLMRIEPTVRTRLLSVSYVDRSAWPKYFTCFEM